MTQSTQPRLRFQTLEAGRFFAALGVVLFHYAHLVEGFSGPFIYAGAFAACHVGVKYFFVLSGFIIYHSHSEDFRRSGALTRFALKRASRLYPLFWAISLMMLAAFMVRPELVGRRDLSLVDVIADLLLLPKSEAILSISWTLRHEAVFYALFGLALWRGRKWLVLIAAWIALSLVGGAAGLDHGNLGSLSVVASILNLGFGLGILIAMRIDAAPLVPPRVCVALGFIAMLGVMLVELSVGPRHGVEAVPLGLPGELAYLLASAAVINGLVRIESQSPQRDSRGWWVWAGGSSYALYLLHQPLGSLLVRVMGHLSPALLFPLLVGIAVVAAAVVHRFVERPVMRMLQLRMVVP